MVIKCILNLVTNYSGYCLVPIISFSSTFQKHADVFQTSSNQFLCSFFLYITFTLLKSIRGGLSLAHCIKILFMKVTDFFNRKVMENRKSVELKHSALDLLTRNRVTKQNMRRLERFTMTKQIMYTELPLQNHMRRNTCIYWRQL